MGNTIKKRKEKKGSHYSYLLFLEKKTKFKQKILYINKVPIPNFRFEEKFKWNKQI